MIEVHGDPAEQQRLPLHAGVFEARAQFLVFRAPALDRFVEAVHANQVVAPEGLVAALYCDEGVGGAAGERREDARMQ